MRVFVPVTKMITELRCMRIACNRCGTSLDLEREGAALDANDFHDFVVTGGYGTTYPSDMETIHFTLCGLCLLSVVGSFKLPVQGDGLGMSESDMCSNDSCDDCSDEGPEDNCDDCSESVTLAC